MVAYVPPVDRLRVRVDRTGQVYVLRVGSFRFAEEPMNPFV